MLDAEAKQKDKYDGMDADGKKAWDEKRAAANKKREERDDAEKKTNEFEKLKVE